MTSPSITAPPALAPSGSDRCFACDARLTPDQRYCVECGQRRGSSYGPVAPEPARTETAVALPARGPRATASTTLVAGVGTLLLALGIGVLIGRSGQHDMTTARTPVQIVTVGGGAAPAASGTATAASSVTPGAKSGSATSSDAAKTARAKKKTSKASTSTTTTSSSAAAPKAVVKVGASGHGAGYQDGKFTGNFFGK